MYRPKAWIFDNRCLQEKTREKQRFTILEVAADWHELMVPRRDMQLSIARDSGQWTRGAARQTYHRPNQPH